jgi:hypothetical protein
MALRIDATGEYAARSILWPGGPVTIVGWFFRGGTSAQFQAGLVDTDDATPHASGDPRIALRTESGAVINSQYVGANGTSNNLTTAIYAAGAWVHFAAVFRGSGSALTQAAAAINGVLDTFSSSTSRDLSVNGALDALWIGAAGVNSASDVREFAVYWGELSPAQITELQTKKPNALTGITPAVYETFLGSSGGFTLLGGATIDSTNDASLPALSDPPAPGVITGPTGAPGAASITTSAAENQNVAGVWTTTGSGAWSLSGTDASLLAISGGTVTKATGTFDADLATGGKSSYAFTVNEGSSSQAVTLNITGINEAPQWIGPAIGPLVYTVGVAITPVSLATRFTDPEGGAVTASIVESLAGTGLSVVSGQLQGTPAATQTATSYTPRGTDPEGNGNNGTAFTIAINASGVAPSIVTQPANTTVAAGSNATFTVSASGSGALTYQWRRNGVNISGATSASYSFATVLGDNGAVFSVVVTGDTAPPATSTGATLTVTPAASNNIRLRLGVLWERGGEFASQTLVDWYIFSTSGELLHRGTGGTSDSSGIFTVDRNAAAINVGDECRFVGWIESAESTNANKTVTMIGGYVTAIAQG